MRDTPFAPSLQRALLCFATAPAGDLHPTATAQASTRPETLPPLSLVNRHPFGSDRSGPGREAAKRTLDGEDRSEIIRHEGEKGAPATRAFSAPLDVSFELARRLSAASQRSVSSFSMSLKASLFMPFRDQAVLFALIRSRGSVNLSFDGGNRCLTSPVDQAAVTAFQVAKERAHSKW